MMTTKTPISARINKDVKDQMLKALEKFNLYANLNQNNFIETAIKEFSTKILSSKKIIISFEG